MDELQSNMTSPYKDNIPSEVLSEKNIKFSQLMNHVVGQREAKLPNESEQGYLKTVIGWPMSDNAETSFKKPWAAIILAFVGEKNDIIIAILAESLSSEYKTVRVLAVEALLQLETVKGWEERIRAAILEGINSGDENVRTTALRALPLLGKFSLL